MRGVNGLPTGEAGMLASASAAGNPNRLDSIDLLRGIVMVVMALDHVRDYFSNATADPVDLARTTPALFLTRWVTHFCAPTFVFLAGTGALLYGSRRRTGTQLSWFLLTRGVWLVFLETTLVRLGWTFNFDYGADFGGGVIWAIGWSMIVMAGLVFLPTAAVAVIGVGLVAFHNLLDGMSAGEVGLPQALWVVLHSPGAFEIFPDFHIGTVHVSALHFTTGYCLLPWLGVMAAGYGFGSLFLLDRGVRRRQLLGMGLALTGLFVVLRYGNRYGDLMGGTAPGQPAPAQGTVPGPWSKQGDPWFTVFSFLNCQKYPPSLLYLLMTLGPAITALGLFDREVGRLGRFFVTFGRVPLFYYLLHIPLIHGLMVAGDYLRYGWSPFATHGPWAPERATLPGYGYGLPTVYLVWLGVVLALYPLCRWYAEVKARYRAGWLSYL
jgi:uncharacterized membrane protein